MGMAYMGLTHCEKCYKPLKDDEYVFCKKCEEENRKKDKSMKMKYKGYELLKAIADGEIKDGTKFKCLNEKPMEYYPDSNIYRYEHGNFLGRFGGFNILSIVNKDFEIVQKQDEIDIDSIGELKSVTNNIDGIVCIMNKINELVQAVKQLKKEVKELENRK